MRLTNKILLWAWLVLLLVFGSLIYGAYSKLNPDSLVDLLNNQIQRSYPGSKLTIQNIDYGFSLDFKLNFKNLSLTRATKTIASANEVQLKFPWWLILFNRGNASININDLTIFVSADSAHSNVNHQPSTNKTAAKPSVTKVALNLPQYLLDAHYTLRAKNISVKEIDGDRRFFTLSKLLVREFQYGKNSAFELNIPISITHKNKRYSSDLWLFGDITPELNRWALNYRGEFKTKETAEGLRFDDLVIDGKSVFDPTKVDLTSTIDLSVERKKVGSGTITAKYDQIEFQLKISDFPMDFLNLIGDEIKNPFWKKIEGFGEGEVKFARVFADENTSSLSAKIHFPGEFAISNDHKMTGHWHLNFDNEKWKTSFISTKQELKFERRALLDFSESRVTQYHQEINFSGFDLKTALLAVDPITNYMSSNPTAEHTSVVLLTNCLDGDRIIQGAFKYGITPQQNYYQVDLNDEKSKFIVNYSFKKTQTIALEATAFPWNAGYTFLLPYFSATKGIVDGKLEGKWSDHWSEGTWLLNLKANELQNASGEFISFNQTLWDNFTQDSTPAIKRIWQGNADKNTIKITSLVLDSTDPAQLTGVLSTAAKTKSYLTLTYPKNKKWKPVKKDVTDIFWKKETP